MGTTSPGEKRRGRPSAFATGTTSATPLIAALAGRAADLHQYDDPETLLDAVVRGALDLVPGATEGSVSLLTARRRVTCHARFGQLPPLMDRIQDVVDEGPGLDAIRSSRTVRVSDLATERRWPQFAGPARRTGAAGILALPLPAGGRNLGTLNLYARRPDAFTDESELVGTLYARHAALAFATVRRVAQLKEAVLSRDLIGQAKGILMERYGISGERAFSTLTRFSQDTNRKLHDIAHELVRTGALAGHPPASSVCEDAEMADPVPSGSDVSAGTYKCTSCGYRLQVGSTKNLPPCPSCGNGHYETLSGGDSKDDPYPDR